MTPCLFASVLALNTRLCCPYWPLFVWFLSTYWFKDGARGSQRLPSLLDFWVSTATGQLLAMSCFPGNTPVEPCPSKYFLNRLANGRLLLGGLI